MKKNISKLLSFLFAAIVLINSSGLTVKAAENTNSFSYYIVLSGDYSDYEPSEDEIITVSPDVVVMEAEPITIPTNNSDSLISPRTTTFTCATMDVTYVSTGMVITIFVSTNRTASTIGVKDIEIQKKVWYGWETVATSAGGGDKNVDTVAYTMKYFNSVYGATYRVKCTLYANVDGYAEIAFVTDGSLCSY